MENPQRVLRRVKDKGADDFMQPPQMPLFSEEEQ